MWPFRRRPDLLEQQRRELERERLRAQPPPVGPAGGELPPFDVPDSANRHTVGFRFTVQHGDGPQPPLDLPLVGRPRRT